MNKVRVDLGKLREHIQAIHEFNKLSLRELELIDNGQIIEITEEAIQDWEITGLNNRDFIEFKAWKGLRGIH